MESLPKTSKSPYFGIVPALPPSSSLVAGSHSDKKSPPWPVRSFPGCRDRDRPFYLARPLPFRAWSHGTAPGEKAHKDFYSDLRWISCMQLLPVKGAVHSCARASCKRRMSWRLIVWIVPSCGRDGCLWRPPRFPPVLATWSGDELRTEGKDQG